MSEILRQCSKGYSLHKGQNVILTVDIFPDFIVIFRIKWFHSTTGDSVESISSVDIRASAASFPLVKGEYL